MYFKPVPSDPYFEAGKSVAFQLFAGRRLNRLTGLSAKQLALWKPLFSTVTVNHDSAWERQPLRNFKKQIHL